MRHGEHVYRRAATAWYVNLPDAPPKVNPEILASRPWFRAACDAAIDEAVRLELPDKPVDPRTLTMLKPGEVAVLLRVDPKTVGRWAATGKIPGTITTPGGHHRIPRASVDAMLAGGWPGALDDN